MLLEYFWWGSVFLLALPVMALLLVLGPRLLPEYRDPEAGRLDLPSAGMSLAATLAVIYGLKQIALNGFGPVSAVVVLGGLAGRRSVRAPAASQCGPIARPPPVPDSRLQRGAGDQSAHHLRGGRLLPVRRAVPATGVGVVTLAGGPLVAAFGSGVHRRLEPGTAFRAPRKAGTAAGYGPGAGSTRPGGSHTGGWIK